MSHLPTGTVTFLFADIEESTTLLQRLGDRRYADVLAEHQRLLRDAFAKGNGREVDTQGDAFLVVFSRARDAVAAAVAAQQALMTHPWPEGASLKVRMGLHTGEPITNPDRYVCLDVHRAARIGAAGHGGQVVLSDATHGLVAKDLPEGVSLRDLGEHRLKDLLEACPDGVWMVELAPLSDGTMSDSFPLRALRRNDRDLAVRIAGEDPEERRVPQRAPVTHTLEFLLRALPEERESLRPYIDRAKAFSNECGCSMGGIFLLGSLVIATLYAFLLHGFGRLNPLIFAPWGAAFVFSATIVGKLTGIGVARVRLALLYRHVRIKYRIEGD